MQCIQSKATSTSDGRLADAASLQAVNIRKKPLGRFPYDVQVRADLGL